MLELLQYGQKRKTAGAARTGKVEEERRKGIAKGVAGVVVNAALEIDVSYKQSWWPFSREERYPFAARRDVQGAVHWVQITPHEESRSLKVLKTANKKRFGTCNAFYQT